MSKTYISIKSPCKHCGSCEKYISSQSCVTCNKKRNIHKLYNKDLMSPYRTKEKSLRKLRRWRKNNYSKWQHQWLDPKNKHKRTANAARYRGRMLKQTPANTNFEKIDLIYEECRLISDLLQIPHEVDHIIPLAKGGLHHQDNLQIITAKENRIKGSK